MVGQPSPRPEDRPTEPGVPGILGIYQALFTTKDRPLIATVTIDGAGASGKPLRFTLPDAWPPKPAETIMKRVDATYAGLRSLVTHEQLSSGPRRTIDTLYKAVAPSSLTIKSSNGIDGVVIGTTRWDKQPGRPYRRSTQRPPLKAIKPYWEGAVEDATLLDSSAIGERPVWLISFAALQMPAFFEIAVDKKTNRVLDLHMIASAHFMHHRYGLFDVPPTIRAPA